jgi:hypothetical protein
MIARLKTVTADPSSLHGSGSSNLSPFLTLEATLVHRDDHGIVDRIGLLMIDRRVRHVGTCPDNRMWTSLGDVDSCATVFAHIDQSSAVIRPEHIPE